jgi:hypothetical protein
MSGKYAAAGSGRNHGYGRDMAYAGHQALQDYYGGGHFSTVATHSARFNQFSEWAKENEIRDIAKNDPQDLLERYADHVGQKVEDESLTTAYGQNLISSAQVVLRSITGNDHLKVSPAYFCGARSNVRLKAPESLDRANVEQATTAMRAAGLGRAAAVAQLAREFGMREREATLADLTRLAREVREFGSVNVQEGTKGGRNAERWVPVSDQGRSALNAALAARPDGSQNLLAAHETFRQFVDGELRNGRELLKEAGIAGYHDCRAGYACDRYQQLTGDPAPVVSGGREASRDLDLLARQELMTELGHGRDDVSISYIGGRT